MIGLDGRGTWGLLASRLYDALVARGQDALYDQILDEVEPPAAGGELLDVGCGPGHAGLRLARRHPRLRLVGLDSSSEMVRLASRRAAADPAGARLDFVTGDAMSLPFAGERFQGALSIASIKHWPDRARGLRELHRVLAPGARLVIVEADRGATDAVLDEYARRWPWLPARALRLAYRGYIARGSIDRAEARALLDGSPFGGGDVYTVEGTPLLCLRVRKA